MPLMYLKTPLIEEKVRIDDEYYLVDTRIEVSVYEKSDKNFCSIITKDWLYKDGKKEIELLEYIDNVSSFDDVMDLTDNFMETHT